MSSLPFWDSGAILPPSPTTLVKSVPGIQSFIAGEQAAAPWPDELSPWETLTLAGVRVPGVAKVEGGRRRRLDHRTSAGASGETASDMGYDPGEFTITLTLWTPMQFLALQNMIPLIQPPATAKVQPKAVKISHPACALLNIYDVYIESIDFPRHVGKQIFEVVLQCFEFMPPIIVGDLKFDSSVDVELSSTGAYLAPKSSARQPPPDPSSTNVAP